MKAFSVELQSASRTERIENVFSFVGQDASGSFGLQPGHARFMTVLEFGLARLRRRDGPWLYIALPGGLLYFAGEQLLIATRNFLTDRDYGRVSRLLHEEIETEEQRVSAMTRTLRGMEEELLRHMWESRRERE